MIAARKSLPTYLPYLLVAVVLCATAAFFVAFQQIAKPTRESRALLLALSHAKLLSTHGIVLQDGSTDCGPAAVANLLEFYGKHVSLQTLTAEMHPGANGVTAAAVARALTAHGVRASVRNLSAGDAQRHVPFIALRAHHFVVITGSARGFVQYVDPWIGLLRQPERLFDAAWGGVAVVPVRR